MCAWQQTQAFNHAEGKATGQAGQFFVLLQVQQRFKQGLHLAADEVLQATLDLLRHIGASGLVHKNLDLRRQRIRPGHQFAHRILAPHEATLFGEIDLGIGCIVEPVRPQMELRRQRLQRGRHQGLGLWALRSFVRENRNPSNRPTNSPSTVTSPLSFTSAKRASFCLSRRRSTDVRRSTNL